MDSETEQRQRLMVVSNRLPIIVSQDGSKLLIRPGAGGLITALVPILLARGGVWIGWPGTHQESGIRKVMSDYSHKMGYSLQPVLLTEEEIEGYYHGFSNEILWPLFHGFETRCNFNPAYWHSYEAVNQKFADSVAEQSRPGDFIWIHDYQLMLVADQLRQRGLEHRLGFFLHIPFPAPEVFFKLPWRTQLLRGLLAFDLLGFQTVRHRRNFIHCLQLLGHKDLRVSGRGDVVTVNFAGRTIRVGSFPISVDYKSMSREAGSEAIRNEALAWKERFGGRKLIVGIDRLDYTKGIPDRLEAFRLALKRHPELLNQVCLLQVTVPSRENVPEYERLRRDIEHLVGEINGEFTSPGDWVPIHYIHRSMKREEVYSCLRAADMALVTPLRDGMNLVAKEYCACQVESKGVLVLSEFAGAAAELKVGALLINPYDIEGSAETIFQGLMMDPKEKRERMGKLRGQVARNDIFRWLDEYLNAAIAKQLSDFPLLEDHLPDVDLTMFDAEQPGWSAEVETEQTRKSEEAEARELTGTP